MKYFFYIVIMSVILLSGCEQLTSTRRFTEDHYYVVTGKLYENLPVTPERAIFIGKTIPAEGGNLMEMLISDAAVQITDLQSNVVYPLEFVNEINGNSLNIGYYDASETLVPQAQKQYRLEAVFYDNLTESIDSLWAVTTVPQPIEIEIDSLVFTADTTLTGWPELVYETANLEHPLTIKAEDGSQQQLYFLFYCLENWQNARYINPFADHDYPDDEEEYEDPTYGYPRKIEYFNLYMPELDPEDGLYYIIDRSYKGNFIFYGRYSVTIYNIDDNFYQYLYRPEGYNFGGINNGIGYFGAVSGNTIFTRVIE
ncbi:MAG: DUF4249 family protein [Candidatus Cloacimonetes bacterium]|nr:DUF4249 family protein [Candidatus Cloacimonadota bacterium]